MKLKLTRVASTLLLLAGGLSAVTSLQSNSGGITGKSQVGCASGGSCHGGSANTSTTVSVVGIPGGGYTPGQMYTIGITVTNASQAAAGFNMTVDKGSLAMGAGTGFAISGMEARHTTPQTMTAGTAAWSMNWTAPAAGAGTVTFHLAGNAVNLNGGNSGDIWNVGTFTFNEATSSTGPTVTTGDASAITDVSATLNGTANANGGTYGVGFQLGTTTTYGTNVLSGTPFLSGSSNTSESGSATGLMPSTLYHFRLVAVDLSGDTTFGGDKTFTTLSSSSVGMVQSAGIRVYPNPATDRITVDLRNAGIDVRTVRVTDLAGREVRVATQQTANGLEVQTAALPVGQYHVIMADKHGKLLSSTFTKQ